MLAGVWPSWDPRARLGALSARLSAAFPPRVARVVRERIFYLSSVWCQFYTVCMERAKTSGGVAVP